MTLIQHFLAMMKYLPVLMAALKAVGEAVDEAGGDNALATISNNRFINSGYVRSLDDNSGWRYRAYRLGDWDIQAGQFFSNWRGDTHVVDDFTPPRDWRWWAALDHGFQHPTVCLLFAQSGDGDIYVVDEHAARRWLTPRHADAIAAMLARYSISLSHLHTFVAGADVFAQRGQEQTIADRYTDHGIYLRTARQDRIAGAARVLAALGDTDHGISPALYIMRRCTQLVACLPQMQHDPDRPEDVLKLDADDDDSMGDDAYDARRYGLMAINDRQAAFAMSYANPHDTRRPR